MSTLTRQVNALRTLATKPPDNYYTQARRWVHPSWHRSADVDMLLGRLSRKIAKTAEPSGDPAYDALMRQDVDEMLWLLVHPEGARPACPWADVVPDSTPTAEPVGGAA